MVALVVASLLWGTTGTAASFMPPGVSPLAVGAVTMCLGGLLLFVVSIGSAVAVIRDRAALRWLVVGAVAVFVYPLAFYSGMHLAGIAIGNVVALGSGPVFAALLEWILEHRRPERLWTICTAIAVVGIALLAFLGRERHESDSATVLVGVGISLLAGLAYATYTYASSRALAQGHGSRAVMGGMFGLGAVLLLPVLILTGAPLLQTGRAVGISCYLIVAPMFVAYLLFGIGLRTIRSSAATTITLLEPVLATVLAVTIVGERLTVYGWCGLAMILIGVAAMATARLPATGT